jgi:GNAT superfamily N-acetyltransferase
VNGPRDPGAPEEISASAEVQVRPMVDGDLPEVMDLLLASLGSAPGEVDRRALFEWKHLGNPFGRSLALVAEIDGRLVGLRAFMRWRFAGQDGEEVSAVRAVDTATSPEVRRRGIFSRLTREALEACRDEGVAFVFNTPNAQSLPGYLKMGWREVARWPVLVKIRRPGRLLGALLRRNLHAGAAVPPPADSRLEPAGEVLFRPEVERLVAGAVRPPGLLSTPRTPLFMKWRYGSGPLPYHALLEGDPPDALAVVRLRSRGRLREAVVCEALSAPGGRSGLERLLRALPRACGVDHAVAHFGPGWPASEAAAAAGFRRVPRAGITFTARPVAEGPAGARALDPSSWSLTLCELEVF